MGFNLGTVLQQAGQAAQRDWQGQVRDARNDYNYYGGLATQSIGRNVAGAIFNPIQSKINETLGVPQNPHYGGGGYVPYGATVRPQGIYIGNGQYDVRPPMQMPMAPTDRPAVDPLSEQRNAAYDEALRRNALADKARYLAERQAQQPAAPAVATPVAPTAAPTAAPVVVAPTAAAPVADLAVQQQQAYLKALGYTAVGKLDGKSGPKTEAALQSFAVAHKIDPNDKASINKALVEEINHSDKAKALMEKAASHPDGKGLTADERKEAQWILKGQGNDMPKSERNGKMDGQFGAETKTTLAKPHDYATKPAVSAAPSVAAPVVAADTAKQPTVADMKSYYEQLKAQSTAVETPRAPVAEASVSSPVTAAPTAKQLEEESGIKSRTADLLALRGGGGDATLSNVELKAAPAVAATSPVVKVKQDMGM